MKKHFNSIYKNGSEIVVNDYGLEYIHALEIKLVDLEQELKAIKPVIEHKDYKPCVSADCYGCKYSVRSIFGDKLLGCFKDNVCEDFVPKEINNERS